MTVSRLLYLLFIAMVSEWILFYRQNPFRFLLGVFLLPLSILMMLPGLTLGAEHRKDMFLQSHEVMKEQGWPVLHKWVIRQWEKTANQLEST